MPVDELPALRSLGASMQDGDERFNSDEIRSLYDRGRLSVAEILQ